MAVEYFKVQSSRQGAGRIAVVLYLPETQAQQPLPTIIMAIGIGAINVLDHGVAPFAKAFNEAGYAAITFDYLTWGASAVEGKPKNVMSVADELQDYRDVIAWARAHPERLDPKKLVAWGSSFGGMHVTSVLSDDHELAAGIAQCPLVDGFKASLQIPPIRAIKLGISGARDMIAGKNGKPVYVPLYSDGSKKAKAALMAGPHVVEGWDRVFPGGYDEEQNRIRASIALTLMAARPVTKIHKSTKPILYVLPEWDKEAALPAAEKAAKLAPKGEMLRVTGGHFDLYAGGPGYEKNLAGQLEFLKKVFAEVQA